MIGEKVRQIPIYRVDIFCGENFQKCSTVVYHYGQMINYRAFLFSIQFTLNRLYKRFVFFLVYSCLLALHRL